jgi:hypothetical protein
MAKGRRGSSGVAGAFIESADRFISVIDGMDHMSEIEFLRHMDELVPLVYSRSQQLHALDSDSTDDDSDGLAMHAIFSNRDHAERYRQLSTRIEAKLGRQNKFRMLHDPFAENERPVAITLSDVLSQLYLHMKSVVDTYRRVADKDRSVVLSRVVPATGIYWGHDAVEAILGVHWLVHHHYDEIGDEFFPIYSDEEPSQ